MRHQGITLIFKHTPPSYLNGKLEQELGTLMYRTVLWTLWERVKVLAKVGSFSSLYLIFSVGYFLLTLQD